MKNPQMKVKIKHSESKNAWNIIGTMLGSKYKIARVPYNQEEGSEQEAYNTREKAEALIHAEWITYNFNK